MLYLILAACAVVVFGAVFYMATLKRCASNEALLVSGKLFGENKNKPVAVYKGGTVNVIPLIQHSTFLKLTPMNIDVNLKGALSKANIRVNIPSNFQIAFSGDKKHLENAAQRLVDMSVEEIKGLALDIIVGGMRAVIASLTIEEINGNRELFMREISRQVEPELSKIGLEITNVNIQDIIDEAGYIEALGRKAAAQAVEKANIEVAEQEKLGAVGTAEQEAIRKVEVEKQQTLSTTGVEETKKERTVQVARLAAETEKEKINFEKEKVEAKAELEVAKAQAEKLESVALSQSQQAILAERKKERQLEMEKEIIVEEEIEKRKIELKAQAQAAEIREKAKADADAIKARAQAEAEGIKKVLDAKASGYKEMFSHGNAGFVLGMEYLKIATELQKINAEAVKNIKIDKIDVIDSGNGKAAPNFLEGFIGALPKAHQIGKNIGIDLPAFMGESSADEPKRKEEPKEQE